MSCRVSVDHANPESRMLPLQVRSAELTVAVLARAPARPPITVACLLMTLALGACESDVLCLQDDPSAFHLVVRDRDSGARLSGVSGTVTNASISRPIVCLSNGGVEECFGWARGNSAAIHVTRPGSLPWDTTGVRVYFTGGACNRPIERDLEVRMQAAPETVESSGQGAEE